MGAYINPQNMSKEEWLNKNGKHLIGTPKWEETPADHLPVVLIDNGMFTAAGIAYDEGEFMVFAAPDPRPKLWFFVERNKLYEVSDLKYFLPPDGTIR